MNLAAFPPILLSMAQNGNDEEKLDFTCEGEAFGYISLNQARILAMRTAKETPGDYGRRFRSANMAFEVVEDTETEDPYGHTISRSHTFGNVLD